jgi:phage baseplate assembly protein W
MSRLAFPFAIAPSGRSATTEYGSDEHVKQMLELLVLTVCGERPMRPDLGSPAMQMVFRAGNGPVAVALQATLQAAITQWLGHVLRLDDLAVSFDEATAVLEIRVEYETILTRSSARHSIRRRLG